MVPNSADINKYLRTAAVFSPKFQLVLNLKLIAISPSNPDILVAKNGKK